MSAPADIENGDIPDATVLMAWFNYLAGGAVIRQDTYNALRAVALASPATPFICIATDQGAGGQLYVYMGNTLAGDAGFVLIGG